MKWLFNLISRFKYLRYKKQLDSVRTLELSNKEGVKLQKKLDKFVNNLTSQEIVYLGTLYDKFWLELSFMEAMKYIEVKKLFERAEIEALQHYIIRGVPADQVNKLFVLRNNDVDSLVSRFRKYCASILKSTVDSTVN